MSGMLSWITGGGAQQRKAAPKDAIVALRAHLDMLQKREQHLQNQMDEQDAVARRNVNTNKNGERSSPPSIDPNIICPADGGLLSTRACNRFSSGGNRQC